MTLTRHKFYSEMNRPIAILALGLMLSIYTTQAYSAAFSEQHEQVKNLFKSNEEITAKDALWTTNDIFKIGVLDNGSNRDGYAIYACEVLNDYGFKGKGVWVQIIDIKLLVQSAKWVKLGEYRCQ